MTPDVAQPPTTQSVKDLTHNETTANISSDERHIAIIADLEEGLTYRAIAAKRGVSTAQVARVMAKLETYEHAARKYMAVKGLQLAEDWITASGKAADRGNHVPAKEALLHLGVIDPVQDTGSGTRVNIMIGAPGAPVPYPAMVIEQPPK